ncbi:MAG: choice-of-anchor Q domain-containing protein [Tahibacter sp.]
MSACFCAGASVQAATINVSPDGLSGCTLRQAIRSANTDSATPPCTTGSGTDTLVLTQSDAHPYFTPQNGAGNDEDGNLSGDLDITSTIIIQGANPTQSIIVGPPLDRALDVLGTGSLTLNDVTVIGGSLLGVSGEYGGVVRKGANATLTINRSVLRSGKADRGGAVYASGSGLLTLDKVSIFDNFAIYGGGVMLQQTSGFEAVLNNLTLSGNTATVSGGGMYSSSWFRLRNSTVARNRGGTGGGILFQGASTTGVNLANSVLVDNASTNGSPQDLFCSSISQLGARTHTMIGTLSNCTFASFAGIPPNSDARLSPLFDFGSGLPTHALMPGSAALDAGNPSTSNTLTRCLTSDTRGVSRPTSCDLGAYEEKFDAIVNSFSDLPDLNPGDGVCLALGNVCTLRAVAQEGSASRGRWFVKLPAGTYALNRAFNPNVDADGGDLDVKLLSDDEPFQMTLYGAGDADDVKIVSAGFDRVLEVRGSRVSVPAYENIDYPLAFALLDATLSGGVLHADPFEDDPNAPLGGGGIKVIGGKSLFYNVVVKDNYVEAIPPTENSVAGGMFVSVRSLDNSPTEPYVASNRLERFAIVDNATSQISGGQNKFAGGLYADGSTPYEVGDSITLVNGTIANNASVYGGGLIIYGGVDASFVSVVNNTSGPLNPPGFAQYAGGLTLSAQNNTLRNVLIAGNMAGPQSSDCIVIGAGSSLVSLGYNLIGTSDASCVISGDTSSNLLNVAAQLGPRVVSSGMPVYSLSTNSPAIDAIPLAACANGKGFGVAIDATGESRPGSDGAFCSIGSVEIEPPLFADDFE